LQGLNPYLINTQAYDLISTDFDWEMLKDLHDKILSFAGLQVVCELDYERRLPDELRPQGMPGDPSLLMTKTYCFEQSRERIEEHGPHDNLTVTFNECLDRKWEGFDRYAKEGWPLDPDAVSAAMDVKQTWSGVSKIVLRRIEPVISYEQTQWYFELLLEGETCQQVVMSLHLFDIESRTNQRTLSRRLTEQLQLKHTWTNFVHEYYI
jgi:hypothetical protein